MADLTFKVSAKSENATKTVVATRGFQMIVDEPESLGGTDQGATPVEYMLAALAGCLNVVGHLVAREMGFQLRGLELALEGNLNPAKFAGKSELERAGYKEIRVELRPETDADQETLNQWLEIVEARCPVSDNFSNATPVRISVNPTNIC